MRGLAVVSFVLALLLAGAMAWVMVVQAAVAAEPKVRLEPPREHGWWIGDVLTARAWISVDGDGAPDPASLPHPGALDYWLDLRAVQITKAGDEGGLARYQMDLTYQTFYAPLEPKRLTIPPLAVAFSGERGSWRVEIPAWTFVTSPLREILAPSKPEAMAPASPLNSVDPVPLVVRAGAAGGVGLLALLVLLWHRGIWPFTRRSRPFGQAARALKGGRWRRGTPVAPRAACVLLHRAFDDTLGRRMLADDISFFLSAHPDFAALEADIRAFHRASRALIYGEVNEGAAEGVGRSPNPEQAPDWAPGEAHPITPEACVPPGGVREADCREKYQLAQGVISEAGLRGFARSLAVVERRRP
jgi:mxaA protein